MAAVKAADPTITTRIAAIDEPNEVRPYGSEVRWRIQQGDVESYRAAAAGINASNVDVVNVQHEFGLYGTWADGVYTDHLSPFLRDLDKPVVTTLHSVPPEPSPSMRDAIRSIVALSDRTVVMADAAVGLLAARYGISEAVTVIPHGMPAIEPHGRVRMKEKLGVAGRTLISTFGLVDPRKGLEYMVEAMPAIRAAHPSVLYLIAGQTHPELIRRDGERYRNQLLAEVERLGLKGHVSFLDLYLAQRDIIELLLATDVYVTPYLDPQQITSGTLAYALGAGKAIVSTGYLHAVEALAEGRGLLVGFRDAPQLAAAVGSLLDDPAKKRALETAAYAYAKDMAWPRAGERWAELMHQVDGAARPVRITPVPELVRDLGARLANNPILTTADVPPSQPELEVMSVFNAAAARVGDETILLLRVAERPRALEGPAPAGAVTIDLAHPEAGLEPLPAGIDGADLIGFTYLDAAQSPPAVIVSHVRRDLPGIDLSDPRRIRVRIPPVRAEGLEEIRDYLTQMSHLRVARGTDGAHFTVDPKPAVVPQDSFEEYGCEDPRATLIDGVWHITYVSVGRLGITTSRLTTTDFCSFERKGMMFLPDHKDVTIFPGRVGGRYVALTRPMPGSFNHVLGIWIAFSEDLVNWGGHRPLALPRYGMWDALRTGASAVPFRVEEGWLELYHGVDGHGRYAMGALLLDAEDPSRVIGRSPAPILQPQEPYELSGLYDNTVFSCGHVALDGEGERIRMYYGAADSCMAAADFSVREIIASLTPC
jgi:beta-1,2-mannobiose phosphorylase / 1,2-beta-oligomannan phosphorylase